MKIPGKIPITITPAYWIFTAILSFLLAGGNALQAVLWMVIIFISIVFHEFGHALTAYLLEENRGLSLLQWGE